MLTYHWGFVLPVGPQERGKIHKKSPGDQPGLINNTSCGADGGRTRFLMLAKHALGLLSFRPKGGPEQDQLRPPGETVPAYRDMKTAAGATVAPGGRVRRALMDESARLPYCGLPPTDNSPRPESNRVHPAYKAGALAE